MAYLWPAPPPKQFVLCFDGTGNRFSGDTSDTNVLKIYRMLDRTKSHQFHYYQPGIGTYVSSNSLSSIGRIQRIRSAYLKMKDAAIGSSFDEHVLGGYKFLMRYYTPGDDIYMFGFSRGSYTARFLAEMLDFIGLLEAGNEELIRFAWKTFAKWQRRSSETEEDQRERKKLFKYMLAFRETFSRPIKQIRFMGLFDTVNSVPAFENPWMRRSRFPYTARSSAHIIRHAVSIDERRAKFRQDLISGMTPWNPTSHNHPTHHWHPHIHNEETPEIVVNDAGCEHKEAHDSQPHVAEKMIKNRVYRLPDSQGQNIYRVTPSQHIGLTNPGQTASREDVASIKSDQSGFSLRVRRLLISDETEGAQDIKEVWFAGQHGDVGGGWKLDPNDEWPLSHIPLVWMVQEAKLAGLRFDSMKLKQFECHDEPVRSFSGFEPNFNSKCTRDNDFEKHGSIPSTSTFHKALKHAGDKGIVHDCLRFGGGLPSISTMSWWIMEYLPFRRMDLQPDGSWKPINWPLPYGEVRDIPNNAEIHVSAIRRMQADSSYRPGNLIIGGGGRGVKRAPEKYGIGEWIISSNEGDPVRETYVRKGEAQIRSEA
ncbi:hypothetical protein BGW36DRAFT_333946 [Talaromyces proteolyticus]|uniref:T6SS Phospholipase effector Tle1-like catalytic domain-containing protein n=1 Tax=Talaromyces proteolyticus TaxID=1131652 RepID=A0AAD4KYG5_9EURO|nr:uncharacterized protein BGW36DRAFT_333946 [Talaromyces proteolyticus]KAH8703267.1 hypothetical protein BGW36DRAFT_333946 [Talaromyces proteolyticus]